MGGMRVDLSEMTRVGTAAFSRNGRWTYASPAEDAGLIRAQGLGGRNVELVGPIRRLVLLHVTRRTAVSAPQQVIRCVRPVRSRPCDDVRVRTLLAGEPNWVRFFHGDDATIHGPECIHLYHRVRVSLRVNERTRGNGLQEEIRVQVVRRGSKGPQRAARPGERLAGGVMPFLCQKDRK